jgi:hypothetical protein
MDATNPISWSCKIQTTFISLKNNFGTLTLVLGCFPFDIQPYRTMSDYSIRLDIQKKNKEDLI